MQENRSFDHYFGTMRGVRGFGDPHPVTLPYGQIVFHQPNGGSEVLPSTPTSATWDWRSCRTWTTGWDNGHQVLNGGLYDQWVPNKAAPTMAYLTRQDIPFHYVLADAFTV
jgi:phospholipase C